MDETTDLRGRVLTSLAWLGGMKYIGQMISWAMTIIVIRILNPGDFGLMAMANICVNFLIIVSELGLGAAIIQKQELDRQQLSQLFGFILISHFFLALALYCAAPFIADFFSDERLTLILQVLSANFLLLALYVIPRSVLVKNMHFKRKSLADLFATVFSASISLICAFNGCGVWSLVWAALALHIFYLLGYGVTAGIFVLPQFSFRDIKDFISFGAYTLMSRILWYFYSNADIAIGGRMLGNQLIGIYSVAQELAAIPLSKFMPIITEVAFPAYSSIQSDIKLVGSHFLKTVRLGGVILFPIFWGFFSVAPEAVAILLGPKWEGATLPLQLVCLIMPFRALGSLIAPMLLGLGYVKANLLCTIIAAVIMPLAFYTGTVYGAIAGLCLGWIAGFTLVFLFTLQVSLKLIELKLTDFFSNILVGAFASSVMVLAVTGVRNLLAAITSLPLLLGILVMTGVVVYPVLVYLIRRESLGEILSLMPESSGIVTRFRKLIRA